jgi:hypothetical protein
MGEELRSFWLGSAGLGVVALLALLLTVARGAITSGATGIRATVRIALIAIVLQAGHFAEELATGFPRRFPSLLGLAPWPDRVFVPFNLIWLAIWIAALWGLTRRYRASLFPLWFLALGCVANGIVHVALTVRAGAYFPGVATAPLAGIAGILLVRRLLRVTAGRE